MVQSHLSGLVAADLFRREKTGLTCKYINNSETNYKSVKPKTPSNTHTNINTHTHSNTNTNVADTQSEHQTNTYRPVDSAGT